MRTILVYSTTTGQVSSFEHAERVARMANARPARRPGQTGVMPYDCPGCTGEASKSVGVMLGCPLCPL